MKRGEERDKGGDIRGRRWRARTRRRGAGGRGEGTEPALYDEKTILYTAPCSAVNIALETCNRQRYYSGVSLAASERK